MKNPHAKGETISVTFNHAITLCLRELIDHGGFGNSPAQVVDGLVRATVRELELQGFCGSVRGAPPAAGPASGRCALCGCTDAFGCDVGCAWANADHTLCTACLPPPRDVAMQAAARGRSSARKRGRRR